MEVKGEKGEDRLRSEEMPWSDQSIEFRTNGALLEPSLAGEEQCCSNWFTWDEAGS